MNKNLLLASGAAAMMLVTTGCATKAVAPAPAPAPVKSYVIEGVLFSFDSASLTPAVRPRWPRRRPASRRPAVPRSTWSVTPIHRLGCLQPEAVGQRAKTVAAALYRSGVPASQLNVSAMESSSS